MRLSNTILESETTRNYICFAYMKAMADLAEAESLAPFRDDKNKDQIKDLKRVVFDLKQIIYVMDLE